MNFFLYLTVFITGMSVTAVELTASRLLAPYFGASLFVWTNIIGVVLLALSIGYYVGGRVADRNEGKIAQKLLYPLILVTGILVNLIPFVGKAVFMLAYEAIPDRSTSVFLASFIATLILFTLPLILLGMVSPLAARIGITKLESAGRVLGSLYAFSTVGSIVGTFIPVLLTVPFLGSRETFFLFGGVLIVLGAIGTGRRLFLGLLALPIAFFALHSSIHADPYVIYEDESVYNYIRVREDESGNRALLTNEGYGIQSLYSPLSILTGYYWDEAAFLPAVNPAGENFLIIGMAGGSSARVLHHFFPELKLHGVEIDPLMVEVGKRFFGADKLPLNVTVADGRVFLQQSDQQYDFIMVDVYRDELYIPFHLATKDFFQLVSERLTPKGSMVMNIASVSKNSELLNLIKNTLTSVFPYVYEHRVAHSYNSLLFAFQEEPDFSAIDLSQYSLELRGLVSGISPNLSRITFRPEESVSEDNTSTLEFLTEKMILSEAL